MSNKFWRQTESVSKPTFEKNYEIVKKAHKKKEEEEKIQLHIQKLLDLLNSYESKTKTIYNASELICKLPRKPDSLEVDKK